MKPYIIENEELMKEWDWEKNNAEGLNPEKITEGSGWQDSLMNQLSFHPFFVCIIMII